MPASVVIKIKESMAPIPWRRVQSVEARVAVVVRIIMNPRATKEIIGISNQAPKTAKKSGTRQ